MADDGYDRPAQMAAQMAYGGVLAVLAALALIGLLLPWQPYHEGSITRTLSIETGDGLVVITAASAMLLIAVGAIGCAQRGVRLPLHGILDFVVLLAGVACAYEAVHYAGWLTARSSGCAFDPGFDPRGCLASAGAGIYAVAVAGTGIVLCAVISLVATALVRSRGHGRRRASVAG